MLYQQTNTCKKILKQDNEEEYKQEFDFNRKIRLYPLANQSEKKVYYDKELKMHFESSKSYRSYEIEVADVFVDFDKEIRKAQDFHRRLNYKYDWIHVEQCSNSKITNVDNLKELRNNWNLLKKRLEQDYIGGAVERFLDEISDQFADNKHFESIFNQYSEYGLLFPCIPQNHRDNWQGQRIINLDNTPESRLIETTTLIDEDENFKTYNLKLDKDKEYPSINVIESNGELKWCKKDNFIHSVNVDIKYSYDETITNEWTFALNKH